MNNKKIMLAGIFLLTSVGVYLFFKKKAIATEQSFKEEKIKQEVLMAEEKIKEDNSVEKKQSLEIVEVIKSINKIYPVKKFSKFLEYKSLVSPFVPKISINPLQVMKKGIIIQPTHEEILKTLEDKIKANGYTLLPDYTIEKTK